MKYLLLIYGNQEKWSSIPAAEWPEAIARQDAFNRKYQETGELIGLPPDEQSAMMETLASVGEDVSKSKAELSAAYQLVTDAAKRTR